MKKKRGVQRKPPEGEKLLGKKRRGGFSGKKSSLPDVEGRGPRGKKKLDFLYATREGKVGGILKEKGVSRTAPGTKDAIDKW